MLTSDVCTPRGTLAHPSGRASGKVAAWEERARGGQDAQRPVTRGNVSPPGWSEPVAWLHAVLRPGVERLLGAGGGAGGSHSAVDTGRKLNFSGVTSAAPPPTPPPASDSAPAPRGGPGGRRGLRDARGMCGSRRRCSDGRPSPAAGPRSAGPRALGCSPGRTRRAWGRGAATRGATGSPAGLPCGAETRSLQSRNAPTELPDPSCRVISGRRA